MDAAPPAVALEGKAGRVSLGKPEKGLLDVKLGWFLHGEAGAEGLAASERLETSTVEPSISSRSSCMLSSCATAWVESV